MPEVKAPPGDGVAYLFQGNYLVVPSSAEDEEAVYGVDRERLRSAFGELDFYGTPAIASPGEPPELIPGALLSPDAELPPGWRTFSVRQAVVVLAGTGGGGADTGVGVAGAAPGSGTAGRLLRAYHVLQWRKDSLCCGSCGERNGDLPGELARLCPRCGRIEYPRISPAVITLVLRDDGRALLAHNVKFSSGVYSLIAGFTEAGENLESTVLREIKEEVGIEADTVRYVTSQSWPFPNSLMVGFSARYAGGELKPDGREITDARWFSREQVAAGTPALPNPGSVSRFIIDRWLTGALPCYP
ncbi:MAG: NAD(+) diphosphatase [Treponema sp.]|jgi:NAD+ diphosphatase|nr:NAD(+) diphosphatase [Treponema sp.]